MKATSKVSSRSRRSGRRRKASMLREIQADNQKRGSTWLSNPSQRIVGGLILEMEPSIRGAGRISVRGSGDQRQRQGWSTSPLDHGTEGSDWQTMGDFD